MCFNVKQIVLGPGILEDNNKIALANFFEERNVKIFSEKLIKLLFAKPTLLWGRRLERFTIENKIFACFSKEADGQEYELLRVKGMKGD